MPTRLLSPRENEIVQLSVEGMTTDAIAVQLGLSVGAVNTYWLRIKLNIGGKDQTVTLAKAISDGADQALRDANIERADLASFIAEKEQGALELRAAVALLHLAMDQIRSTVWATDTDLAIHVIVNGEFPSTQSGVVWEEDKTVYEIFKTTDRNHPAVAAHIEALAGKASESHLGGEFDRMMLRVNPLLDENDKVIGCISVLFGVGE